MGHRVLLIDDEKYVVETMQKSMQRSGYEVQIAYNGQEGLYAAQHFRPHLIITDIAMPVMDGFMFYQELRNSNDIRNIPVIITSAYGMREDQFRQLGARNFLVKPFNMTMLLTIVDSFFPNK